ncbi:hypothetical protein C0989_005532 [Termitomyces sp. Mn162]|nr:hypothetical protein C0989_005532 [Termitomyces sp. Mn162]
MFHWAREQARDLDNEFSVTKRLRGPLHGVPLVTQFLAAGAVVFVKTNVPQTMFAFECSNPLWGRSTNPHNDRYTCGGSSGGEAALLAMDGSAIGIGSDIGGSLRIPAAYCGIYSLKPSTGRISFAGTRGPVEGFEGIKTVVGPMARSVEDLQLVSQVTFGIQGKEQSIAPIPYRHIQLSPKLRFGYYTSDHFVKASPACQRAVLETVEALRKKGHECIEINVSFSAPEAFNIFVGLTSADGYKKMLSHLGPDPKVWNKYDCDGIIAPVQAVPQLPHDGCNNFSALAAATILYNVLDHPVGCLPVTHVDPSKDQISPEWTAGLGHGSSLLERGVFYSKMPLYNPIQSAGMPIGIQIIGKKWEEEKVLEMMRVVDDTLGRDRGFGAGSWKSQAKDRSS